MRLNIAAAILLLMSISVPCALHAKEIDKEFIKQHLKTNVYAIDTEASAIVLYENIVEAIQPGSYRTETVHEYIKILKADGVSAANRHVRFYQKDAKNYIRNVKGITYNLVGDSVVETANKDEDYLRKDMGNNISTMNFSLPAVKPGSVIEYTYEIVSGYYREMTWHTQEQYPKLLCEYSLLFPKNIEFTTIAHIKEKQANFSFEADAEESNESFCFVKRDYVNNQKSFWLRKNVPGIKDEPYIVNIKNYTESLELQMTGIDTYWENNGHFADTWAHVNDYLWYSQELGKTINSPNSFFKSTINYITKSSISQTEQAKAIYKFVRDNFTYDAKAGKWPKMDMHGLFNNKRGDRREINCLLAAMLKCAGIDASPVIMSTTDEISPNPSFPVLSRTGFLACVVSIDSGYILLDAANKNNYFGALPAYSYNGFAWILGDAGKGIYITPDDLIDKSAYSIKIFNMQDSSARCEITEKMGHVQSANFRRKWDSDSEAVKKNVNRSQQSLSNDINIISTKIENTANPDTNVIIRYTAILIMDKSGSNYFLNTNIIGGLDKNPFKTDRRQFPIEFPYTADNTYSLSIELPKDMVMDGTAAPVAEACMGGELRYRKSVNYFPEIHTITINAAFIRNKTTFPAGAAAELKDFYQKVVTNNNQMLVLKKTE